MKIAVAQCNPVVGDFEGNIRQIVQSARDAYAAGARILVTPELAICGYIPEDLLLRPAFMQACDAALARIAQELAALPDFYLVLGHPVGSGERTRSFAVQYRHNAASVIHAGQVLATYAKHMLPNYQVFDERRYFVPGNNPVVFEVHGVRYGVLICEDIWFDDAALQACKAGAQVLLVPNASPYHASKQAEREQRLADLARKTGASIIYANLFGGQDELVFDGGSFAVNSGGELAARATQLGPELMLVDAGQGGVLQGQIHPLLSEDESLWRALVLGLKDYFVKNGFRNAVLGLSGGIDSALVLAIAVDALGAEHVSTVMMPSPYTADISLLDARDMAQRLNVRYDEVSILDTFNAFRSALVPVFKSVPEPAGEDTTEENIQARVRGTLLMAISNKTGALVLTTGNKSELATGYCTLYGDMAGGFAVIKDLVKTRVYRLARWRNENDPYGHGKEPIPERIITRAPSAELRPDQTDQDSLPPYDVLDQIIERYVEEDQGIEDIVAAGFERSDVDKVTRLIKLNEYKRRQAPVGIRLTHRAFGRDWRYPITSKFRA